MAPTRLTKAQLHQTLANLVRWKEGHRGLERHFVFDDFATAMAFMVCGADHAEALGHHPNWSNVNNRVEVEIWSHDAGGITSLCVRLAESLDACSVAVHRSDVEAAKIAASRRGLHAKATGLRRS